MLLADVIAFLFSHQASIVSDLGELSAVITPTFVALTLWRLNSVEKKIDKLDRDFLNHIIDNKK